MQSFSICSPRWVITSLGLLRILQYRKLGFKSLQDCDEEKEEMRQEKEDLM